MDEATRAAEELAARHRESDEVLMLRSELAAIEATPPPVKHARRRRKRDIDVVESELRDARAEIAYLRDLNRRYRTAAAKALGQIAVIRIQLEE